MIVACVTHGGCLRGSNGRQKAIKTSRRRLLCSLALLSHTTPTGRAFPPQLFDLGPCAQLSSSGLLVREATRTANGKALQTLSPGPSDYSVPRLFDDVCLRLRRDRRRSTSPDRRVTYRFRRRARGAALVRRCGVRRYNSSWSIHRDAFE